MNTKYRIILILALSLLGTAFYPAYAQKEIVCYRHTKTVYDNGKIEDQSKANTIRYYLFTDWNGRPELEKTWLAEVNAEGIFLVNYPEFGKKERTQWKLGLIDNPYSRYYPYFFHGQTFADSYVFNSEEPNVNMIMRVAKDKSVINIYYRKNKVKGIYVTDVFERIDPNSSIQLIR